MTRVPSALARRKSCGETDCVWRDAFDPKKSGHLLPPQNCAVALILVDVLAIVGLGAGVLQFDDHSGAQFIMHADARPLALALVVALYLFIAYFADVYDERRIFDAKHGLSSTGVSIVATFALASVAGVAAHKLTFHAFEGLLGWASSAFLIVAAIKLIALNRVAAAFQSGHAYVSRVLTVGVACDPVAAAEIARRTKDRARTIAVRLGDIAELGALCDGVAHCEIDRIYVTSALSQAAQIPAQLHLLTRISCETFVSPYDLRTGPIGPDAPDYVAVTIIDMPFDRWRSWFKRWQDILIAATALTLAAPILTLLALAIKIESRGPVLSRRRRVGDGEASYTLWTFRSTDEDGADARMTRVGRFMRRTSLDRLPLLANVLQGRLSIVGPRPFWADSAPQNEALRALSARYAASHRVNPGLTGLAQVEGFRGEPECAQDFDKRLELDWAYIEKRSIWLDLTIMIRTIAIVVSDCIAGDGAVP